MTGSPPLVSVGADPEQEIRELGADELGDRGGDEEPGEGPPAVTAGNQCVR